MEDITKEKIFSTLGDYAFFKSVADEYFERNKNLFKPDGWEDDDEYYDDCFVTGVDTCANYPDSVIISYVYGGCGFYKTIPINEFIEFCNKIEGEYEAEHETSQKDTDS